MDQVATATQSSGEASGVGGDHPALTAEQELVLAELIAAKGASSPALRHAVVPVGALTALDVHAQLARTTRRAQDYLDRATRAWERRGGDAEALATTLAALAQALVATDQAELAGVATALSALRGPDLLRGALHLDRRLLGEHRRVDAAERFAGELERQLGELQRAYPPTPLEDIDLASARSIARDCFIRANMHLAIRRARVVHRWSRLAIEDLTQVGHEWLIHAVDKFDPRYGVPFAVYGYGWIRQGLGRAERHADLIPLPHRAQALRRKIRRAIESATGEPDLRSIATDLDVDQRLVATILHGESAVVSLEYGVGQSVAERHADEEALTPDEHFRIRERRLAVARALEACTPRGREILGRYYGIGRDPQPIAEIAQHLGLTPQRVYQLRDAELRRLRRPSVSWHLVACA